MVPAALEDEGRQLDRAAGQEPVFGVPGRERRLHLGAIEDASDQRVYEGSREHAICNGAEYLGGEVPDLVRAAAPRLSRVERNLRAFLGFPTVS